MLLYTSSDFEDIYNYSLSCCVPVISTIVIFFFITNFRVSVYTIPSVCVGSPVFTLAREGDEVLLLVEEVREERSDGWVPLACLVVSQTGVALGVNGIPFILSQEYFPTAIRPQVWPRRLHGDPGDLYFFEFIFPSYCSFSARNILFLCYTHVHKKDNL